MNELIQEIAEKAGLRFTQLMSNPMVPVVDGKETDLEKFAELLVTEVTSTIAFYSLANFDSGSVMREECANLIRLIESDFGVEQNDA